MVNNAVGLVLCSQAQRPANALAALIVAAQDGDVLAPVDVVVPSGLAGVTLRRAAAGPTGLANVRFATMPQLAERLSARHLALRPGPLRRPLVPGDRSKAVQQVLTSATGPGKLLAAAKRQRATAGLLEEVFAELEGAQVDGTLAVAGLSGRGREVLQLYGLYRAQVVGLLTPTELLDLAIESVVSGNAPDTQVILMASGSLAAAEKQLLAALHTAGRLSAVLPTVHTADTADWLRRRFSLAQEAGALKKEARARTGKGIGLEEEAGVLAGTMGALEPRVDPGADPAQAPGVVRLVVAPDAEEEVRIAVRTTLEHLASSSCRPERIGIAYRTASPYSRLLAEQLTVAEVPHHVPSQRTLAQTVAGRAVLGLLSLHDRGFPRPDVLSWMADGPILDTGGHRVPAARWDRLSREAGVSRGLDTWQRRLTRYAEDQQGRAVGLPADTADLEGRRAWYGGRAADARALLLEVEELHLLSGTALLASNWSTASERLLAMLRRALGSRRQVDGWSTRAPDELAQPVAIEQGAYDAVTAVLQSLAGVDLPVDPASVVDAVTEGLTASVPSGTTLGRGVLVGTVGSFAGADLDLLLVVGATEDALPARQRESTVLRDADRALLSADLATVASRRADEREQWVCALASAKAVHLSYPRADTRSQRRQFASPWFLEQAQRLNALVAVKPVSAGEAPVKPVSAAEVDEGDLEAPWFTSYPSFDAALRDASTHASSHELDVGLSLDGRVDELALTDARLGRGLEAARSRARGAFSSWSGNTGALPASLRSHVDAHLSASTLQSWASCPTSHLYGAVLGVRDLEDRAGDDTINALDKGTLVHGVLEALVRGHLGTVDTPGIAPDTAWSQGDIAHAIELLEAAAAALTERGLTGRELLWTAQLARLRRALVGVLAHDSNLRRQRRAWPIAVEAAFGRDGVQDLVVDLPNQGPVPFAGYIDRVDATEAGGLVVIDYKTGKGNGFDAIPKHTRPDPDADLVDRGRKLQLLLYGLAARQLQGLPDAEVQAWFWFVEQGDLHRGGPVDPTQEQRLKAVLDVVVGGIRDGVYPVNPGSDRWQNNKQTWDSCAYCAFDLVCPTTRAEQWQQQRKDSTVRPYADLVDPPEESP